MKKYLLIGVALAAGLAIAFTFANRGSAALNVNDIGADPGAYTGKLTVVGVTAGVSDYDPTLFGIFDKKELQCKSPNCNKLILPVKFGGQMPKQGDEVIVTGSFVKAASGYFLSGDNVRVVRNHKIGG
ncbi:MAG TPA: hypothetical protein VNX25_04940 [Verrucomicrobiae bacterium]|nr:hypothetical protein [Verrucomicrobiae bacterium]